MADEGQVEFSFSFKAPRSAAIIIVALIMGALSILPISMTVQDVLTPDSVVRVVGDELKDEPSRVP